MSSPANPDLSPEQSKKLEQLISALEEENILINNLQYPCDFLLETPNLLRYLNAWEWNVDNTKKAIKATHQWYNEYQAHKISAKEIEHHFKQGKNYHNGLDKQGRQIVYMRIKLDTPEDSPGKLKIMLYQMERSIRRISILKQQGIPVADQIVWIVDCTGFSMRYNAEVKMAMQLLHCVTNHYPERLGMLYLLDTPWIWSAFWNIFVNFLTKSTVQKIMFISGTQKTQALLDGIDAEHLEEEYGGQNQFKYDHDTYFDQLIKEEESWFQKLGSPSVDLNNNKEESS